MRARSPLPVRGRGLQRNGICVNSTHVLAALPMTTSFPIVPDGSDLGCAGVGAFGNVRGYLRGLVACIQFESRTILVQS